MRALTLLMLFCTNALLAQNLDSLGANDSPFLNKHEAGLLNALLQQQRGTFDFQDKKVAFVTGNAGSMLVQKSAYFHKSVIPWIEKGLCPQIFMARLTDEEKLQSGGYDVLVLSWVKLFTDRRRRKTIEALGTKH